MKVSKKFRKSLFLLNREELLAEQIWKSLKKESYKEKAVLKKFWKHFQNSTLLKMVYKIYCTVYTYAVSLGEYEVSTVLTFCRCSTFENIYAIKSETSINLITSN